MEDSLAWTIHDGLTPPAPIETPDPCTLMQAMGMEPDEWQAQLLRSTASRILTNCSRQSGKSSTVGVLAVHTAAYTPDSLVLLVSPALRQSQELFRKCLDAYRMISKDVPADIENKLTLELANGSRIISLPGRGDTIRGYSGVRLLIIDEASWVPDELYTAVRPMLAVSAGRLIVVSTPFGKQGFFYESWIAEDEEWERYEIPATMCPRISEAFLAAERNKPWFDQEYMCQFSETSGSVFRYEDVAALAAGGADLEPLFALAGTEDEVA